MQKLTPEQPAAETSAGGGGVLHEDDSTRAYFDDHAPEYTVARMEQVAAFIRQQAQPGATLLDVGCGVGNTLEYLRDETGVTDVAGLDISSHCLELTRDRLSCQTYEGSILDPSLVKSIGARFDFVVLAAVLHHLIGHTRRESKRFASLAVANALNLVRPGGFVVIHEPIYSPSLFTTLVFWAKKIATSLTGNRVEIVAGWANIGPPVVSYLTNEELLRMVIADPRSRVVDFEIEPGELPRLVNYVFRNEETTVAVQRR